MHQSNIGTICFLPSRAYGAPDSQLRSSCAHHKVGDPLIGYLRVPTAEATDCMDPTHSPSRTTGIGSLNVADVRNGHIARREPVRILLIITRYLWHRFCQFGTPDPDHGGAAHPGEKQRRAQAACLSLLGDSWKPTGRLISLERSSGRYKSLLIGRLVILDPRTAGKDGRNPGTAMRVTCKVLPVPLLAESANQKPQSEAVWASFHPASVLCHCGVVTALKTLLDSSLDDVLRTKVFQRHRAANFP